MAAVVLGIVALSVAAVIASYGPTVAGRTGAGAGARVAAVAAVAAFLLAAAACALAYVAAVATPPGGVPPGWHPFESDEVRERKRCARGADAARRSPPPSPSQQADAELRRLMDAPPPPSARLAGAARPRWCKKCAEWKPDRSHHCSVRGACVLRMDHYCVWVVNTVGLLNYKVGMERGRGVNSARAAGGARAPTPSLLPQAFLLFLFYTFLASIIGASLLGASFARSVRSSGDAAGGGDILILAGTVVDAAFALSVAGFLVMHVGLISRNVTTIEAYEKARVAGRWPHDGGRAANWASVFGHAPARWFWPFLSKREKEAALADALRKRPDYIAARDVEAG